MEMKHFAPRKPKTYEEILMKLILDIECALMMDVSYHDLCLSVSGAEQAARNELRHTKAAEEANKD